MRFGIEGQRAARTLATFDTGFSATHSELVPLCVAKEAVCGGDVLGLWAAPRSPFSRFPSKMNVLIRLCINYS